MLSEISGWQLKCRSITKPGAFLHEFADLQNPLGQRTQEAAQLHWDAVILQDQSSNPWRNPEDCRQAAAQLRERFGAQPRMLMYQTWAYRDGSPLLASTGMEYGPMRDALRSAYQAAADAARAERVPAGDGFSALHDAAPDLNLYHDDYHPLAEGSYIAACLMLHALTGAELIEIPTPVCVCPEAAARIRVVLSKM